LQGENLPSNLDALRSYVCTHPDGEQVLRFYLFALMAMMCGIRGTETLSGSLFMHQANASNMLRCFQCLQQLHTASPHAIYWGYICSNAAQLGLPTRSPEQLTLARLACLIRASTASDCRTLQDTWNTLPNVAKHVLMRSLLADGLRQPAFQMVFLPAFFVNARSNNNVGFRRALMLVVDVVALLGSQLEMNRAAANAIRVDLSELAELAKQAKCSFDFDISTEHMTLSGKGTQVQVLVQGMVVSSTPEDEKLNVIALLVRRLSRYTNLNEDKSCALGEVKTAINYHPHIFDHSMTIPSSSSGPSFTTNNQVQTVQAI